MGFISKKAICAMFAIGFVTQSVTAGTLDEWEKVQLPQRPEPEAVSVDPTKTALLMLDFNRPPCDPATRPRCAATIPAAQALLEKAKAAGVYVIYTLGGGGTAADMDSRIQPSGAEPTFTAPPNKFLGSDLETLLKSRGIETIIPMGAASNGSILYTSSEAAFRGYKVVVPVDGISAATVYAEQFTIWQLLNGPAVNNRVKLTRTDTIKFAPGN
ncbi:MULTISPECIES: isochorismatase family protein [unclassified Beijerinckia]|uniref:cysteine hydrolase family protein n=1 Tax=unclassified Beijerinckia TaxID=2638183 RepID=UPI00089499ED|nr:MULTISPECIES: isochorismatase family protein [unclassified Beijerinckia]MDH7797846.1 nicotinamidase-related amidase [Beijerinckia sp. GAS462]SED00516.1 Nicotinamidase-related amidase [Beijerinckia sp. 28-YEA-48]